MPTEENATPAEIAIDHISDYLMEHYPDNAVRLAKTPVIQDLPYSGRSLQHIERIIDKVALFNKFPKKEES